MPLEIACRAGLRKWNIELAAKEDVVSTSLRSDNTRRTMVMARRQGREDVDIILRSLG